jgi:hypothetical protein
MGMVIELLYSAGDPRDKGFVVEKSRKIAASTDGGAKMPDVLGEQLSLRRAEA